MNWKQLSDAGRLARHRPTPEEVRLLRGAIARNLADSAVPALSPDNRFGVAYEAALLLGKIVLAAEGWRPTGLAAHATIFVGIRLALGDSVEADVAYLDLCRRKRNILSYEHADVVTIRDAEQLTGRVRAFESTVLAWMRAKHPSLIE